MKISFKHIICFMLVLFTLSNFSPNAEAQAVDEPLPDQNQEALAREIMVEVRCLVCQNQSIEDSDADLAKDLRIIVREQVAAGKNKEEISQFLLERYGDWILLNPPVKTSTLLLWFGPFVFLTLLGAGVYFTSKNKGVEEPKAKPEQEKSKNLSTDQSSISARHVLLMVAVLLVASVYIYTELGKPQLTNKASESQNEDDVQMLELYHELESYVELNPQNLEAIGRFADLSMEMQFYAKAANAYGQLYAADEEGSLLPLVLQGEALVRQAQGTVTPAARLVFLQVVTKDSQHPAARYYLGLWFMQNEEPARALGIWKQLKADSLDDAPWLPMLNFQINSLEANTTQAVTSGGGTLNVEAERITAAMPDVANMSEAERADFINSMVERLRARLEQTPNDYQGWWRLARVEVQRGNFEAALLALEQAEKFAPALERGKISAEYMQLEQALKD